MSHKPWSFVELKRCNVHTIFRENNRTVSPLIGLLQTCFQSNTYDPMGVTPAVLRLTPIWDPLRGDPAFQKLYEDKQR